MGVMLTEFRTELIDLIDATFNDVIPPDEPVFVAVHDGRLPRLMGADGNHAGVSPEAQSPSFASQLDQQTSVLVQFYMKYEKSRPIDPLLVQSPAPVEEAVQKFQEAVQDAIGTGSTGARWFYTITDIAYPNDPLGQKTRAEIRVVARGTNPAITETV